MNILTSFCLSLQVVAFFTDVSLVCSDLLDELNQTREREAAVAAAATVKEGAENIVSDEDVAVGHPLPYNESPPLSEVSSKLDVLRLSQKDSSLGSGSEAPANNIADIDTGEILDMLNRGDVKKQNPRRHRSMEAASPAQMQPQKVVPEVVAATPTPMDSEQTEVSLHRAFRGSACFAPTLV